MTRKYRQCSRLLWKVASVLTILVPLVYFFSPMSRSIFPLGFSPEQVIISIVGLLLALEMLVSGRLTISRPNLSVQSVFLAFCVVYFGTLFVMPFPIQGENLKASVSIFGAQAFLLLVVTHILGRSWWAIRRAVDAIVMLNIVLVLFGMTALILSRDIYFFRNGIYAMDAFWVEMLRTYTVLFNPNYYARSLLFSFVFLLVPIETSERQAYRYLCYGTAIGSVILILLTFSRANIVVLGIILLLIAFEYRVISKLDNQVASTGIVSALAVGSLALLPLLVNRFLHKVHQFTEHGTTMRVAMVEASLESFSRNPFFGTGPNTSTTVLMSDPAMREAIITFKGRLVPFAMHNNFLLILVESGAIGLTLFVLFLFRYWKHLLTVRSEVKNRAEDLTIAVDATVLVLIAFLLTGMTAVNFGMNIIWYMLAIPFAVYHRATLET